MMHNEFEQAYNERFTTNVWILLCLGE